MRAQITLSVAEGKKLIIEAIYANEKYQKALKEGKVLLKGGTTVSALAEKTIGIPLKISGRITARGARSALEQSQHPHSILIENGKYKNIDDCFLETVLSMDNDDVIVVGANAIDVYGNAVMMAGAPGGGAPGAAFSAMACEGIQVIIACGVEKLIPGNLRDLVSFTGRKMTDVSMGMAVGLLPLYGDIITEVEASSLLENVRATVIGKGGIGEGTSALTMLLDGEKTAIVNFFKRLDTIRGAQTSGMGLSMIECEPGPCCKKGHLACLYRSPNLLERSRDSD